MRRPWHAARGSSHRARTRTRTKAAVRVGRITSDAVWGRSYALSEVGLFTVIIYNSTLCLIRNCRHALHSGWTQLRKRLPCGKFTLSLRVRFDPRPWIRVNSLSMTCEAKITGKHRRKRISETGAYATFIAKSIRTLVRVTSTKRLRKVAE